MEGRRERSELRRGKGTTVELGRVEHEWRVGKEGSSLEYIMLSI